MSESEESSWLAGIIEGEGSFIIKARGAVVVAVTMTDLDVLERIKEYAKFGTIYFITKRKEHWKDSWKYMAFGENAYILTKRVLPLMLNRRRDQAQKLINSYESSLKRKVDIRELRRGVIKMRKENGMTHSAIASHFGIGRTYVTHILAGVYSNV